MIDYWNKVVNADWNSIAAFCAVVTVCAGTAAWLWNQFAIPIYRSSRQHYTTVATTIGETIASQTLRCQYIYALHYSPPKQLLDLAVRFFESYPKQMDHKSIDLLATAISFFGDANKAAQINLNGAAMGACLRGDPNAGLAILEGHQHGSVAVHITYDAIKYTLSQIANDPSLTMNDLICKKAFLATIANLIAEECGEVVWPTELHDLQSWLQRTPQTAHGWNPTKDTVEIKPIDHGRSVALRNLVRRLHNPSRIVMVLSCLSIIEYDTTTKTNIV